MSSSNIPLEIQIEILKRAPVKSLLRFRSVSKQWKSVIDSSEFINGHTVSQHHLLVTHNEATVDKFVLIADDESFPQRKFSPTTVSVPFNLSGAPSMLDCSHGLLCLYGFNQGLTNDHIILWNPAIRKSVGIIVPDVFSAFGFGVCPKTRNPKIVKIRGKYRIDWKAEVFTLSSGCGGGGGGEWRSVSMNLLPYASFELLYDQLVAGGAVYWVVFVKLFTKKLHHQSNTCVGILSFDLTTEEFKAVDLPDSLAREVHVPYRFPRAKLRLSKLNESLVVLDYCTTDAGKPVCDVWKMMLKNDGVPNSSFTKLFTLEVKDATVVDGLVSCTVSGFRMNGQPIMKHIYKRDALRRVSELEVYEPGSQHNTSIGIYESVFQTTRYTESLLLLNHVGSII